MENIEFLEIKDLLETIWDSGKEEYWYRKAWECLAKKGLTSCESREKECMAYIRVATLNMIYGEFCELAYDEVYGYECISEKPFDSYLLELEIGQLYAKHTDGEFVDELNGYTNYALRYLAESQRETVFKALFDELGLNGMLCGMYGTSHTPGCWYDENEDEDEDEDVCNDPYGKRKFKSYDEYWDTILNDTEDCLLEIPDWAIIASYEWLLQGTYWLH